MSCQTLRPRWRALLLVALLLGCSKSPAEQLIDQSLQHMKAAERMMRDADGNLEKLIDAVGQYRLKHHGEFRRLRAEGQKALAALDKAERERLTTKARASGMAALKRIEGLSQKFKQPKLALRVIHPLLLAAPPKPGPAPTKPRSLLPEPPPLPMPGAATPTRRPLPKLPGQHGHEH